MVHSDWKRNGREKGERKGEEVEGM